MGCDIHYVVEKRHGGKWVGLFSEQPYIPSAVARNRCYSVFGTLADGVRGRVGPMPARGLPDDASDLTRMLAEEEGDDGHTHSWVSLAEFYEVMVARYPEQFIEKMDRQMPGKVVFGAYLESNREDDSVGNYRVVFWFDN